MGMSADLELDLDVWDWDKQKVATYFRRQGKQFKRLTTAFLQHNVDGNELLEMNDDKLAKMGIAKKPIRSKFMTLINKLRVQSGWEGVKSLKKALEEDGAKHESLSGQENPDNTNVGATDAQTFACLNRWLATNGADLRKVYFDSDQRILRVRRKIKAGEVILTVPPELFMSTTLARTDSKIIQLLEKKMELGTHQLISIYMLEEMKNKGGNTFWQPYIDVLPPRYDDIPIFWTDEEVGELQGDALSRLERRRKTLTDDYEQIVQHCPGFKETASLEEFMWARTAVITRTYGIRVNNEKITTNLPIDFVMHANKPDTTWGFDASKGCYHITAVRDIPKNKFLTITYGKKANSRFLVNYGFCLPVNTRNQGFIMLDDANTYGLDVEPNRRLPAERYELEVKEDKVNDLVKRCRTIVKSYCKANDIKDAWHVRSEAWKYLEQQCKQTLATFATTLEDDLKKLQEPDLSGNIRNALLSRSGEKQVVDFYRQLAATALENISAGQAKVAEAQKALDANPTDAALQKSLKATRNTFAREMMSFPIKFLEENQFRDNHIP